MNEKAWNDLEADKKRPQPTPPVGYAVQWYRSGNTSDPVPALVSGIEGPGRLKLVAFPINTFMQHKSGVYHVSAKVHDQKGNPTTGRCGSWDYYPEDNHYKLFEAEVARREENLLRAEEEARKASARFAEKLLEREELMAEAAASRATATVAKKKKVLSPEPLPAPTERM